MAASVDVSIPETPAVLLVDDRPENLLALEAVLGPLGARLVSVTSGEAALRKLLVHDFAVILLDVQMPDMDGFETAACIKSRERSRDIPIIFLTALSKDIGHVFKGYEAGAVDYLLKPFDPLILRSKVHVFCELERQRRARARSDQQVFRERVEAERARADLALARAARAQAEAAYERERSIAETLQRDLLPERLPDVPGLAVAGRLRAAGPDTEVGGDWYDALALPGGRLGLVIGDVAGRGVAAAARMGQLRAVARAYALEGHPPAGVVERLNQYQLALGIDQMTTLIYAIVEPDRTRLRFANAGHPPPLLAVAGEEPRLLDGVSPPLGASETWRFEENTAEFPCGTTLVLYTDGLVERRGERIEIGLERLQSIVSNGNGDGVDKICDRLLGQAAALGEDDVTALAVRSLERLGSRARLTLGPDPEALSALRRTLRRWLEEAGAERAETDDVVMAANEAWENAIEHGNAFCRAPIDVQLEIAQGDVVITVRDAGSPGGPSHPDRGRGIELMRALVDEATIELGPYGGMVRLRRRLAARAQ